MALNFPNSPALDDVYTSPDGSSFIWNGVQWVGFSSSVTLLHNTIPLTVEDSGSIAGTAITSINFGEYLDVTYASNRVTVDVNGVWTEFVDGDFTSISRISNVGVGTTNARFQLEVGDVGYGGTALYVNGGIKNTGMVTFTTGADSVYNYQGYLTIGGEDNNTGLSLGYIGDKSNLILGKRSGISVDSTARRNIFIGEETGASFANAGSSDNIYIGAFAGGSYADTNNNIFIGNGVGYNPSAPGLNGSFNVMIGPTGADGDVFDTNESSILMTPPVEEGSYQLVVGAGNTAWIHGNESFYVGIGTNAPEEQLHVDGGFKVTGDTTTETFSVGLGYTYIGITTAGINLYLNESNEPTKINFYSYDPGSDHNTITIQASDGASTYSLYLPPTGGSQYETLTTDGDGNLSWTYPSKWYDTATGIHTTSSVSIGTNIPVATLTVSGDANVSGALTATSFTGNGTGISGIVTSLVAGTNVSISTSFGQVTVNAELSENLHWEETATGISTLSNVSIGSTDATHTLTVSGVTSTTSLTVSGVSTFSGAINASATTNIIPFLYANYGDLPSASTYHGAFAHVHSEGKAYFAHASNWVEIINRESNGTVGTGTETYYVGLITATTVRSTNELSVGSSGEVLQTSSGFVGIGTTIPTAKLSVNGTLDVTGVSTFSNDLKVGSIGDGEGSNSGLLVSPTNGQIISNNSGASGGLYLRTNGTNKWYVDYQSNQFNTGNIEIGPTISNAEITIYNTGNAEFSGIVTVTSLYDSKGELRRLPQNAQSSAYILTSSDVGKHVAISTGGVTVPQNIFTAGDVITVYNNNAGVQMLTADAGVTLRKSELTGTGSRGLNGYALATILCVGTNKFALTGAGIT